MNDDGFSMLREELSRFGGCTMEVEDETPTGRTRVFLVWHGTPLVQRERADSFMHDHGFTWVDGHDSESGYAEEWLAPEGQPLSECPEIHFTEAEVDDYAERIHEGRHADPFGRGRVNFHD